MKIKKIHFKDGYKRFFDLTIDLGDSPKRIIALVGPNGCGKSSVLDGLLYLNNLYQIVGNKSAKDFRYHSMNQSPNFGTQNIDIEFIDGTYHTVRKQKDRAGQQNTIFSFRSPYRYNSNLKINELRATSDIQLNNYGATTSTDLDDKMEENYRRLNIKFNKYLNEADCKPTEAKKKIIGDLNSSIKNCLDLEISSLGDIAASQGTIYFKKTDHPKEFEFNVLSSGEKEVIDILLDLYLRQEEYNDTVFLLDEPELHINTAIQKKLLVEINKLIGPNCQIWLTTHSIGFLRALQEVFNNECDIIQFKNGMELASKAHTLKPAKKSHTLWKELFEIALDDLVHLVSPKRIIYCEGKDKPGTGGSEKGLDAQVYNNIFSEKYSDTQFVSSGGNTELDQRSEIAIAILSKVFREVEILMLKDKDMSSGKIVTDKDRQLYLENNPKNHRLLVRFEIENYLYDKEVLKKYCINIGLTFDEISYDKFVTDIKDQNLKDHTNKIKNFCGITTPVGADQFKLNLSKCFSEDMTIYKELEDCIFNRR